MSGNHSDFFVFWMKVLPIHVINNGSGISQLQGKHKMVKPIKATVRRQLLDAERGRCEDVQCRGLIKAATKLRVKR